MSALISERYFAELDRLREALDWWESALRPVARAMDPGAVVTGRVKTHRSVMGKVYRAPGKVRDWESLGDLVALKVVFPTDRGVNQFADWLNAQQRWTPHLDEKFGEPAELKYRSKQFDLASDECLDSLGHPIKLEVQVRSAVADAWYVVDHRLRYKGTVKLPENLERKLLRLIVFTELFDEEIEAVLAKQAELPEYAAARLYEQITRDYDGLVDGYAKTSRPEALLECLMQAYDVEEMDSLLDRLHQFIGMHGEQVKAVVMDHLHGSPNFVESRDWLYYEPESLIIAERSSARPAKLRAAIRGSDFEALIDPMMIEFSRAIGAQAAPTP